MNMGKIRTVTFTSLQQEYVVVVTFLTNKPVFSPSIMAVSSPIKFVLQMRYKIRVCFGKKRSKYIILQNVKILK